jgi:hypothetical protein
VKDEDIVIIPADKGRMTVVMDKSDYTNKAKTLINDTNTYQPLDLTQVKLQLTAALTKNLNLSRTKANSINAPIWYSEITE